MIILLLWFYGTGLAFLADGEINAEIEHAAAEARPFRASHGLNMSRPAGVTTIAVLFFLAALYLGVGGATMLLFPGTLSMASGAFLLGGLELAGPYMFLLASAVAALIGWRLLGLDRWARWAAIVACLAGCVILIPSVSAAVMSLSWSLLWGGLGIIVRVVVVWYLWMDPVAEQFSKKK